MIKGKDLYNVVTAMVPLYVAMFLAYGSVKWWKIFTPTQCSGINRFVAMFAVPLLSFEFISRNNPFAMNFRFLAADSLSKLMVLFVLGAWVKFSHNGSLEWLITLFSLSTLPNTLVMGIPLLRAMYGEEAGGLLVQIVVLQCIIWYTLLLFLFEYRAACILVGEQFPNNGASIVSFTVDPDVTSLVDGGRDALETEAEVAPDGKLHVTVRRSISSRPSNMTGMEIFSVQSSRNPTPRGSSFNHMDFHLSGNPYPSRGPTPRSSNFEEGGLSHLYPTHAAPLQPPYLFGNRNPELALSPPPLSAPLSKSPVGLDSKIARNHYDRSPLTRDVEKHEEGVLECKEDGDEFTRDDFSFGNRSVSQGGEEGPSLTKMGSSSTAELAPKGKEMPPASVMTKLILVMVWRKLIRNPNTYSSLIGLVWSLISARWNVTMPTILKGSISILSNAGLGMAMFSLGLFMALQPKLIACGNTIATFSMAVKFLTGPAVMAAASIAIGIRGVLLHIAIVQAALPQGIVPFVFSKEYNVHPDILSTGVIFGMIVALPITLLYYFVMGL